MQKYFNIAGPCNPNDHYMLPAQARCSGILELIERKQYFVIHAARQSGKTTLLLDLVQELNASGKYYGLYCSLESVQGIHDVERGVPAIIAAIQTALKYHNHISQKDFAVDYIRTDYNVALKNNLIEYCQSLDKPLVILFDEADCLSNGTLISFLRQLRDGYVTRFMIPFVHSVGLIGMRNIRDYKGKIREDRESLGSASPFNIVTEALTLRNFTEKEIAALYLQHTEQTGQHFSSETIKKVWEYTHGQPWLINAIVREIIVKMLKSDFSAAVHPEYVDQAVQNIIYRRDTHIDSLLERLKEDRVKKIVEPVIIGKEIGFNYTDDDYQYCLDLGLLENADGVVRPSNPIYAEVMMRSLSSAAQMSMESSGYPPRASAYMTGDRLDINRLLADFQQFWRENSEIWIERYQYKEAAPHLILMAFLQRVINKGGDIVRESALGKRRLDLNVRFKGICYPIELKLRYDKNTYTEGKKQLSEYMDKLGCTEGWLVVFDRRKSISWKKKLFWKTSDEKGRRIHGVGC